MRISVRHHTRYRFSEPQGRLVQLLRLTPGDSDHQTIAAWRIEVDHDARLSEGRDGFGNHTTMLYVEGPLEGIEVAVTGEVLTSSSAGVLSNTLEPLPPRLFLRTTPLTMADDAIRAFVRDTKGNSELERLHGLNAAIHQRMEGEPGRGSPARPAAEVWARGRGTSRDLAHVFVAAARALGSPARFVSGYRVGQGEDGGRPAPHGWAEAHVDHLGWVSFDPCSGMSGDETHVRVAVALDAAGAAPVAGSRMGSGDERLDVALSIDQVGA